MAIVALGWAGRIFGSDHGRKVMVWAAALLVGFWFYQWAKSNGERAVENKVAEVSATELERQISALELALEDASVRARKSAVLNRKLERQADDISRAGQTIDNPDHICVSADIVNRLRELE